MGHNLRVCSSASRFRIVPPGKALVGHANLIPTALQPHPAPYMTVISYQCKCKVTEERVSGGRKILMSQLVLQIVGWQSVHRKLIAMGLLNKLVRKHNDYYRNVNRTIDLRPRTCTRCQHLGFSQLSWSWSRNITSYLTHERVVFHKAERVSLSQFSDQSMNLCCEYYCACEYC